MTTTSDLVTWGVLLLIALAAAAAIVLIVQSARGRRASSEELVFGLLVVLGAIVWPQAATVVLLAFIYLELRRRRLS